jgi:hypothetical protein
MDYIIFLRLQLHTCFILVGTFTAKMTGMRADVLSGLKRLFGYNKKLDFIWNLKIFEGILTTDFLLPLGGM